MGGVGGMGRRRERLGRLERGPARTFRFAFLLPALRDYLRIREDNPLMPGPHLRLAACRRYLVRPDGAASYLERACLLAPSEPRAWYLAGLGRLQNGEEALAWGCWRRSLECSPLHLEAIVAQASRRLSARELVENVLPADPELLLAAAKAPP